MVRDIDGFKRKALLEISDNCDERLRVAQLAPSAINSQPWYFKHSDDGFDVYQYKQNILKPSFVTEAGARFYSDKDLAKLQQILLLKYLGFSLDDIRELTIGELDHQLLLDSLEVQLKLVR